MKLSEALEHCINTGLYDRTGSYSHNLYMCLALRELGYPEHAKACQEKVDSLGTGWKSLVAALRALGVYDLKDLDCDSTVNQACLDFFHKWIEELKEQEL